MGIRPAFDIGEFIEVDPTWHDGWPYVKGTRKTVAAVGVLYAQGMSAEEIAEAKYMSMPQVHAALCYYLANREAIDATIDAYDAESRALAAALPDS
jgi:uncharacterized protein (DUF433 family)